jgi:hypothetical protein
MEVALEEEYEAGVGAMADNLLRIELRAVLVST